MTKGKIDFEAYGTSLPEGILKVEVWHYLNDKELISQAFEVEDIEYGYDVSGYDFGIKGLDIRELLKYNDDLVQVYREMIRYSLDCGHNSWEKCYEEYLHFIGQTNAKVMNLHDEFPFGFISSSMNEPLFVFGDSEGLFPLKEMELYKYSGYLDDGKEKKKYCPLDDYHELIFDARDCLSLDYWDEKISKHYTVSEGKHQFLYKVLCLNEKDVTDGHVYLLKQTSDIKGEDTTVKIIFSLEELNKYLFSIKRDIEAYMYKINTRLCFINTEEVTYDCAEDLMHDLVQCDSWREDGLEEELNDWIESYRLCHDPSERNYEFDIFSWKLEEYCEIEQISIPVELELAVIEDVEEDSYELVVLRKLFTPAS